MSLTVRNIAKKGKDIEISDRVTTLTPDGNVATFPNAVTVKARVCTVTGVKVFDDTNTEIEITHKVIMNFVAGITSEKWIKIGNKRIKIVTVDDCDAEGEILILMCTERGNEAKEVNSA